MEVPKSAPASVRLNAHRAGGVQQMGECGTVIGRVPGVLVRGIAASGSSAASTIPTLGWVCAGTVSGPFASGVKLPRAVGKGGVVGSGGLVRRSLLPRAVWPAIGHSGEGAKELDEPRVQVLPDIAR